MFIIISIISLGSLSPTIGNYYTSTSLTTIVNIVIHFYPALPTIILIAADPTKLLRQSARVNSFNLVKGSTCCVAMIYDPLHQLPEFVPVTVNCLAPSSLFSAEESCWKPSADPTQILIPQYRQQLGIAAKCCLSCVLSLI